MLLAIDAGNTNIVFAIFDGEKKLRSWRMATDHNRTGDDYAVWLTQLMSLIGLKPADITDAILASVVPPATFSLTRLCKDHFGISPMMVGAPEVSLGIQAKVDFPNEVGVDRLVNALGAQAVHETPLIVVDIGTATTFDVVDEAGDFVGGIIAPGPNSALEALHRIAAKLPRIEIERPERVIGKGTVGAMRSGIYWGYVGLIEGLLTRIQDEFGRPMTIVATGGLSGLFTKATNMKHDNDPEITERGLRVIYERNKVT